MQSDKATKAKYWGNAKAPYSVLAVAWILLCVVTEILHPSHRDIITITSQLLFVSFGIGCINFSFFLGYLRYLSFIKATKGMTEPNDILIKRVLLFSLISPIIVIVGAYCHYKNLIADDSSYYYVPLFIAIFCIETFFIRKQFIIRLISYFVYFLSIYILTLLVIFLFDYYANGVGPFHG